MRHGIFWALLLVLYMENDLFIYLSSSLPEGFPFRKTIFLIFNSFIFKLRHKYYDTFSSKKSEWKKVDLNTIVEKGCKISDRRIHFWHCYCFLIFFKTQVHRIFCTLFTHSNKPWGFVNVLLSRIKWELHWSLPNFFSQGCQWKKFSFMLFKGHCDWGYYPSCSSFGFCLI